MKKKTPDLQEALLPNCQAFTLSMPIPVFPVEKLVVSGFTLWGETQCNTQEDLARLTSFFVKVTVKIKMKAKHNYLLYSF